MNINKFSIGAGLTGLALFFVLSTHVSLAVTGDVWNSTAPTASNVLCVYNTGKQDGKASLSKSICDYYVTKRPGAHTLGLVVPDSAFDLADDYRDKDNLPHGQTTMREAMTDTNFAIYMAQPIQKYVAEHPLFKITHLAIAKDLPIRVTDHDLPGPTLFASAGVYLSFVTKSETKVMDILEGVQALALKADTNCAVIPEHFNPTKCTGALPLRFAVSYLDGYTLSDIKAMIDKAQAKAPDLTKSKWIVDLKEANNNAYDPIYNNAILLRSNLMGLGVSDSNVTIDTGDAALPVLTDPVVAYGGFGTHHPGYSRDWEIDSVKLALTNRAIIDAYESFFAVSANVNKKPILVSGTQQGVIADGLTANAFGGESYSRSASGGVGTVAEPGISGVVRFEYMFSEYAAGKTLAESFLSSVVQSPSIKGIAFGDPLMRLVDTKSLVVSENKAPEITFPEVARKPNGVILLTAPADGGPAATDLSAIVHDDNLPVRRGVGHRIDAVWTQKSGLVKADIGTPINGGQTNFVTKVTFPQTGRYVIGLTAADGNLSDGGLVSTKDVVIDVAPFAAGSSHENKAPVITSGNVSISTTGVTFPVIARAALGLRATDDGFPNGVLNQTWTKVSGPGNVTFIPAAVGQSSARGTFDKNGTYVLRLTADDGAITTSKEVTITINAGNSVPGGEVPPVVTPPSPTPPTDPSRPTPPVDNKPPQESLPQVRITAPLYGATVSGTSISITADTSWVGPRGRIASVQFKVDGGTAIGAEDFLAPYSNIWNSTRVANGTHTLTAVAKDIAGQTVISAGVPIIVSNTVVTPPPSSALAPSITVVSPSHGLSGAPVQISGTNFTSNNAISIVAGSGNNPIGQPTWVYNVASNPSALGGATLPYTIPGVNSGAYLIKVLNVGGSSNYLPFTVDAPADLTPRIITPLNISCTQGVACGNQSITGTNFTATGNDVKIDGAVSATLASYVNGTQVVFTIPANTSIGTHSVTISNVNGTSNVITLTMAPASSLPTVSSISPSSGPIGTRVTLTGSHFVGNTDNNIQFIKSPYLITATARSSDGTHLSFPLSYNYPVPDGTVLKIYVDNDQYGFSDDNPTYAANPVTFTVSGGSNQQIGAAPTATFTIEGASSHTYTVGQTNHYVWTSTGADTFSSSYTSTGPAACSSGPWVANSANGNSSSVITSAYAGCVWTVTYTARNSQTGQSASGTVTVTVQAAPSDPAAGGAGSGSSAVINSMNAIRAVVELFKKLY